MGSVYQKNIILNQKIEEKKYWEKVFLEIKNPSFIPFDIINKDCDESYDFIEFLLDKNDANFLLKLSNKSDLRLQTILISIIKALIYKYTSEEYILITTPIIDRESRSKNLVNYQLPIGVEFDKGLTFKQLLLKVRENLKIATHNQNFPVDDLVKRTEKLVELPSSLKLLNISVLLDNLHSKFDQSIDDYPIVFHFSKLEPDIKCKIRFDARLYRKEKILFVLQHLKNLISGLANNLEITMGELDILSKEDKESILNNILHSEAISHPRESIVNIFNEQVHKNPGKIALIFNHNHLTYEEINKKANCFAKILIGKGVKKNTIVGLIDFRTEDTIISILAILKAGGIYLPIDKNYPIDRIKYMLQDSSVKYLVLNRKSLKNLCITDLLNLEVEIIDLLITEARLPISDFDSLPFPDRASVNYDKYSQYIGQAMVKHSIAIQATRGCPYKCAYCHKIWSKKHVYRDAQNIFDEIFIYYQMGVRRFVFIDDIFNLNKKNSVRLFNLIIERELDIQIFFPNGLRGDILTTDYIDLMVQAGTINIALALESASPRIQKLINKNLNLTKLKDNIEYLSRKYPQVILELFTMHGFPSETEEEAKMTLDFIKEIKYLHFPYIHILKIYPNTDMEKIALENGIEMHDIVSSMKLSYHELPSTLPFSREFTLRYQADFFNNYFLSKDRLIKVLPYQFQSMTSDEIVQKYNSYLPVQISSIEELLDFFKIDPEELSLKTIVKEDHFQVNDLDKKIKEHFRTTRVLNNPEAIKILLLDLSQFFTSKEEEILYDVVEPPLGLMYLYSYLKESLKGKVKIKIAKSRIDFDNLDELNSLINDFKPDIIGARTLSYYRDLFHEIIANIKTYYNKVPIIAGGPYASSDYKNILKDENVDLVVMGEGELTFCEIVTKMLENNKQLPSFDQLHKIKGVASRSSKDIEHKDNRARQIIFSDRYNIEKELQYSLPEVDPEDGAYIIYTSGTTGNPKGTLVNHENVVRLFLNDESLFDFNHNDVWSIFHSFCFDFSVWEMYGPLFFGAKAILVDRDIARDPIGFLDIVKREHVTVLNQTPSAFYNLIQVEKKQTNHNLAIRYIIFGGEALYPAKLKDWRTLYPETKLINMFGITETTVHVTYKDIRDNEISKNISSLGTPIPTTYAVIVNKNGELLPKGFIGELWVGGKGVAVGYLNNPQLSSSKFVKGIENRKFYRSGDLVRLNINNEFEYLKRIDEQVQLRGFRVELQEIEHQLTFYNGIKDVIVKMFDDEEDKYLCAYYISNNELEIADVRLFLSEKLPDYMIPSYFVRIPEIPLTINGKVDKEKLPEPFIEQDGDKYVEPETVLEKELVIIWQTILKVEKIGIEDSFFNLGGDSINAIKLVSLVNDEYKSQIRLADLFSNDTVKKLAKKIENQEKNYSENLITNSQNKINSLKESVITSDLIDPIFIEDVYPMSDIQKGMVFHSDERMNEAVYHDQMVHQLNILDFNSALLHKALILMSQKHSILRSRFDIDSFEEPCIIVYKEGIIDYEHENISKLSQDAQLKYLLNYLKKDRECKININISGLWRFRTFQLDDENIFILFICHHAIIDGWSDASFMTELNNVYIQLCKDSEYKLASLSSSYKDFVVQQLIEKGTEANYKFWKNQLGEFKKYDNSALRQQAGNAVKYNNKIFSVEKELEEQLLGLSKSQNISFKNICFAAYAYSLYMFSYEYDFVLGLVTNSRPVVPDGDRILGCFLNTVPVRIQIPNNNSIVEYLQFINKKLQEIVFYDRLPLHEILNECTFNYNKKEPIFDVLFNFVDFYVYQDIDPAFIANSSVQPYLVKEIVGNARPDTSLNFIFDRTNNSSSLTIAFEESIYDSLKIEKLGNYFIKILQSFVGDIQETICKSTYFDQVDQEHFNSQILKLNERKLSEGDILLDAITQTAERFPDGIAVVCNDQYITYKELLFKSKIIAKYLQDNYISSGIVAIMLNPSIDYFASILGILYSGNIFLSIDSNNPLERIRYMLHDSCAQCIISDEILSERIFDLPVDILDINKLLVSDNAINLANYTPNEHAYLLYTSGTTGRPNGVLIKSSSLFNLCNWHIANYDVQANDVTTKYANLSFDASIWEIFPYLISGNRISIVPNHIKLDISELIFWYLKQNITISFLPTPIAEEFQKYSCSTLKKLLTGGDKLTEFVSNDYSLYNNYGPTEGTVVATSGLIDKQQENYTIGWPILNTGIFITDKLGKLQPFNVFGELCIGGEQLASGYINKPSLSKDKFLENKHLSNIILYKTGDLAVWENSSSLSFLGREDFQVKIKGVRIEIQEIESVLMKIDEIEKALVIVKEVQGDKKLVAYYSGGKEITQENIYNELRKNLSSLMIPSAVVYVESFPLTANGKVDFLALPDFKASDQNFVFPDNEIEDKLREIWADILKLPKEEISTFADFFEIGGHSLKLNFLTLRIEKEFQVKISISTLFEKSRIVDQSEYIISAEKNKFSSIKKTEKKEYYPLSSAQKRLFIINNLNEESTGYNVDFVAEIQGEIDINMLEHAFLALIDNHESLRTAFRFVNNIPSQVILDNIDFHLQYFNEKEDQEFIIESLNYPFDLNSPPLLRAGIVKRTETKHLLIIIVHHIISDGVSAKIFYNDLIKLYTGEKLKFAHLQYKDYAAWQNRASILKLLKSQEQFWLNKYKNGYPVISLPYDFPRPKTQSFEGDTINFSFDKDFVQDLTEVANEQNVTVYMLILAAYNILLSKLSNQEDIVIGTQVSGRNSADTDSMIGVFVNALALRNFSDSTLTISEFLQDVKKNTLDCFNNQDYKFEDLVDKVVKSRDISRNPLFDIAFNFLNIDQPDYLINGIGISPIANQNKTTKFDLNLIGSEVNGKLNFSFQYCTKLFKKETIERFIGYFKVILSQICKDIQVSISSISVISNSESKIISQHIKVLNNDSTHYLYEDIFSNAKQYPHKIAIRTKNEFITYLELERGADLVASYLRELNIEPKSVVGVLTDRSVQSLVAIFGIHKAGFVYLPVDPKYPRERIKYILKDCRISHILTTDISAKELDFISSQIQFVYFEGLLGKQPVKTQKVCQENAYVLYTSGSTGYPKGCIISHECLSTYIRSLKNRVKIQPSDFYLHTATFSFSSSIRQMFMPLYAGATLRISSHEEFKDPYNILSLVKNESISVIDIVPSYWNSCIKILQSIDPQDRSSLVQNNLREIVSASEPLLTRIVVEWRQIFSKNVILYNMYGQTETAGIVCADLIADNVQNENSLVPFGKPLDNVSILLLDRNKKIVPIGVLGEIHIGNQVPTGYLNNQELCNEKLYSVEDFDGNQHLVYATGDYAKLKSDGKIDFQGRIDLQLKIRGMRVEISEIENILLSIKEIKSTVVNLYNVEDQNKVLVAYVVAKDGEKINSESIKKYLSSRLPDYMIPQYYELLDALPMTTSGKVNRKALPVPSIIIDNSFELPKDHIERQLLTLWGNVLGISKEKISVNSDFFELGGNSLLATVLLAKIHKELKVKFSLRDFFVHPSIKKLSEKLRKHTKSESIRIKISERKEYYPLSAAQRRLYAFQLINPENVGYNMPQMYICKGSFDKDRIEKAIKAIIKRHESLRTAIITLKNGEPIQYILKEVDFELFEMENLSIRELVKPFSLSNPPLFRMGYFQKSDDEFVLFIDMHHIISDAVSHQTMVKEFVLAYENEKLEEVKFQYKDFANWQDNHEKKIILEKQKEYWLNKFSGNLNKNLIPSDYKRPEVLSYDGGIVEFKIDDLLSAQIEKNALNNGVTVFMYLLSIFYLWLNKLTNQDDLVVGTPVAGRRYSGMENIIGIFINTLALKINLCRNMSFSDFLLIVKESVIDDFDNQDYQFDDLVDEIEDKNELNQHPIFNYLFVFQNAQMSGVKNSDNGKISLQIDSYPVDQVYSKFDLSLIINKYDDQYVFAFEYSKDLFEETTIETYWTYFLRILTQVNKTPELKINKIKVLEDKFSEDILSRLNNEQVGCLKEETIVSLFKKQVHRIPEAVALKYNDQTISYKELDERSDLLANMIRDKGVTNNTIVGVLLSRDPSMVIAIFAILKAGGGYLPIDADTPLLRINQIVKDSYLKYLITSDTLDLEEDILTINPDQIQEKYFSFKTKKIKPNDLAYIIYTSGSTGNPKGVMINHENVVRLLFNDKFQFKFSDDDVWTLFHSYNFDFSVWEIFGSLLYGGKLVIIPKSVTQDSLLFGQLMIDEKVTVLNQTPLSFYNLSKVVLSHQLDASNLKYIIFGGDALSPFKLKEWKRKFPYTKLINMYGITETTVHVSYKEILEDDIKNSISNIGLPIPTLSVNLLDKDLNILPIGVEGEIFVGGKGLSEGYINNPELTHEKFIKSNLSQGKRLYKSGDYGRMLQSGEIEYTGRKDDQVKVRGHRIEKGEIMNYLISYEGIQDAVIINRKNDDGDAYLIAYYVSSSSIDLNSLKEYLSHYLPYYMVPTFLINIPKIPLTPNGKIDKRVLPEPISEVRVNGSIPQNQIESGLIKIYSEVLNISNSIYTNDNFFDIGGNSLMATKIVLGIYEMFEVKVPVIEIFKNPTIIEIAKYIQLQGKTKYCKISKVKEKDYYNLTAAQKGLYLIQKLRQDTAYNITFAIEIKGKLNIQSLEDSINKIISRHEVFRTKFVEKDDDVFQTILSEVKFRLDIDDSLIITKNNEHQLVTDYINCFIQAYDLEKELPYKIKLLKIENSNHILIIDIHHVIFDEVSFNIFMDEMFKLYNGDLLDVESEISYKDYAEYHHALMSDSKNYNKQKEFWSKKIQNILPLNIPCDFENNLDKSKGEILSIDLDFELTYKINEFCREHELTHNMFLFGAYFILLNKLTGHCDISIGTVHEGRNNIGLENVIGFFINTLIIRAVFQEEMGLMEFMELVKRNILEAFENQEYNLDEIVKENKITRSNSINSLIETMFVFKNNSRLENVNKVVTLGDIQFKHFEFKQPISHFNIMLHTTLYQSFLNISFEYSKGYFHSDTIELLADNYVRIIKTLVHDKTESIKDIILETKGKKICVEAQIDESDSWNL